ncbi:hypothetical protein QYE76_001516 [Lolium multiflorum]|uniref:Reverse transcriptase Ty1/copia-type domain-containing protein n=1 Tax=Lolium multiflorum TaxID=4521 RepID=A0AAD8RJR2_LOLMU|nr:hypothetical protein QYE76_001516 [Lolium multiflorum]
MHQPKNKKKILPLMNKIKDKINQAFKINHLIFAIHQTLSKIKHMRLSILKFEMSMMGEMKFFLGFEIKQLREGTFINQAKYLQDMLKRFKMTELKGVATPMVTKCHLALDPNGGWGGRRRPRHDRSSDEFATNAPRKSVTSRRKNKEVRENYKTMDPVSYSAIRLKNCYKCARDVNEERDFTLDIMDFIFHEIHDAMVSRPPYPMLPTFSFSSTTLLLRVLKIPPGLLVLGRVVVLCWFWFVHMEGKEKEASEEGKETPQGAPVAAPEPAPEAPVAAPKPASGAPAAASVPASGAPVPDGGSGSGSGAVPEPDESSGSGSSQWEKEMEDRFEGDWNRVMDGGLWLFRGAAIVMTEYDGFSNIEDYKLDKISVWARIRRLPERLMKKKELAEKVAKKKQEEMAKEIEKLLEQEELH